MKQPYYLLKQLANIKYKNSSPQRTARHIVTGKRRELSANKPLMHRFNRLNSIMGIDRATDNKIYCLQLGRTLYIA